MLTFTGDNIKQLSLLLDFCWLISIKCDVNVIINDYNPKMKWKEIQVQSIQKYQYKNQKTKTTSSSGNNNDHRSKIDNNRPNKSLLQQQPQQP